MPSPLSNTKPHINGSYYPTFLFLIEFLSAPPAVLAGVTGLMAFRILETFQAVFAACPAVANTCSVASPASSPYLLPKDAR